ncbi:hypothetical protein PsalMR5_03463 [Piscirickettsia salmonis]|uniref:hypothetical protein n=1 Tax=Piscirickettsia salmonis TaxID=1238 RepID=UPI0012BA6B39|nr:hypothetical protein [Piscirickettsia salmonis]QGP55986.1 hypothetical protein PsalSR1_03456 [Piscirickettsia salmonis]QGP58145.1 hypothetical protein PsalBI1_00699 [Piscirickettsia salmonis]QGP65557.1 hypothetical protein PsalMR5_03463 [Piscirickettsia salmonis]
MPELRQEKLATLRENLSRYVQHLHEQNTKSPAAESMARSLASDTFLHSRTRNSSLSAAMLVDNEDAFSAEEAPALQSIRDAAVAAGFKSADLGKEQWRRLDEQANIEAKTTDGFDAAAVAQALLAAFQREYKASDAQEVSPAVPPQGPSPFNRHELESFDDVSDTERDSAARALRGDMLDPAHSRPRPLTSGYSSDDDDDEMDSTRRGLRLQPRKRRPSPLAQATRPTLTESSAAPPPQKRRRLNAADLTRAGQGPRTASATVADWSTPSLLPGHPANPQPQTTAAAQLTAPSVRLDDSFLRKATRRFNLLTGKDTVISCKFDDQKTKLIAKEAGKEIASVKIDQSDKGTVIQHDGKGPTRQLAASAAAVTLLANPGAKIKVISTGDASNTKIEYQALINAGVKHSQFDLAGLPTGLLDDIKKMQPQRPQRPSGAQFAIGPFERAAKAAGSQKQPAAATPTHIPVGHSLNA